MADNLLGGFRALDLMDEVRELRRKLAAIETHTKHSF